MLHTKAVPKSQLSNTTAAKIQQNIDGIFITTSIENGSKQAKRRAAESLRTVRPKIKRKLSKDELLNEIEVIRKLRKKLLGCSSRTVGDALARWNAGTRSSDTVSTAGGRGRHGPQVTRVPMTRQALTSTQEFVREKRIGQERVTATQVLDFLIERKIVDVRQGTL
eukprot:gene6314-7476_t